MQKNCIKSILLKKKKFFEFALLYLFVYGKEIYRFKAKYSEIAESPFCQGNISKDFQ